MWGVSIAFIIIGAAQYRFRKKLQLPSHNDVESIGRTFWCIGWSMLVWWILSSILDVPETYKIIMASIGTLWLCIRGLQFAKRLIA